MAEDSPLTVVGLRIKNVMRIRAVNIRPDKTGAITIGGKNASGKSTILNSIWMALGGKDVVPNEPIRRGASSGEIALDLGDLEVRRRFTKTNPRGDIQVRSKSGAAIQSPQGLLNSLAERIAFDPLEFASMDSVKRGEVLRKMAGLDIDKDRAAIADLGAATTEANRELKRSQVELDALHNPPPCERIDLQPFRQLIRDAGPKQAERAGAFSARDQSASRVSDLTVAIVDAKRKIEEFEKLIDQKQSALTAETKKLAELREKADAIEVPDTSAVMDQLRVAEETNLKAANYERWDEARKKRDAYESVASKAKSKFEAARAKMAERIAAAEYPVDGLTVDDEGRVLFGNIPFDQCSTAERLKVSVGMAMSMNPRLRVILVREGNDLDSESMQLLADLATENGYQVWVERVEDEAGHTEFFIVDGSVGEDDSEDEE
jgi:DNA repair exonuclease SbcCD ATPase subunit